MIDFPIDEKIERRPHHGEIIIDPDQWIVNAFFNLGRPGLPTRSAKASKVICAGLPLRISTIVPPGNVGALIAAASRFDMPSNIAWMGASAACSSADCATAWVARPVARIVLKRKTGRLACLFMPAILP